MGGIGLSRYWLFRMFRMSFLALVERNFGKLSSHPFPGSLDGRLSVVSVLNQTTNKLVVEKASWIW